MCNCSEGGNERGLLPKQRKQQCQDDADEDGGGEGKVEGKLLFSNNDISGKPSYK